MAVLKDIIIIEVNFMPSDEWWQSQEDLHRRLMAANDISDDDEREEAKRRAWGIYNRERQQSGD